MNIKKIDKKILSQRDFNYDFVRSFLVVSMIFTHSFEIFYLPDYNRRLTFFVTIGFVFISGFSIGARKTLQISNENLKTFFKHLHRFSKIMLLFMIFNLPVFIIEPKRIYLLIQNGIFNIFWLIFTGDGDLIFSFDILPPIAFTTLFSWIVIKISNKVSHSYFLILFFISLFLVLFENHYGNIFITIRLSIIGITGCLLGSLASKYNWRNFISITSSTLNLIFFSSIITLYFVFIKLSFWFNGPILLWRHLLPTIILILINYIISFKLNLDKYRYVKIIVSQLGKYLLFIYVFHIGFIKFICYIFPNTYGGLNFVATGLIGILILAVVIITTILLDFLINRFCIIYRAYSFLFAL